MRHTSRTSVGFRGQVEYIAPVGKTEFLPIFERLFLGGEYSVRGFDIRSIGPSVPGRSWSSAATRACSSTPSTCSRLPARCASSAFFDAGQVRDFGDPFSWKETDHGVPGAVAAAAGGSVCHVAAARPERRRWARRCRWETTHAFKTSTGVELRFFMPVLNVPFRLIYSFNPLARGRAEQPAAAGEGDHVPVRGGDDVLGRAHAEVQNAQFRIAAHRNCTCIGSTPAES